MGFTKRKLVIEKEFTTIRKLDSNLHLPYAMRPSTPFTNKSVKNYYTLKDEKNCRYRRHPPSDINYDDVLLIYKLS